MGGGSSRPPVKYGKHGPPKTKVIQSTQKTHSFLPPIHSQTLNQKQPTLNLQPNSSQKSSTIVSRPTHEMPNFSVKLLAEHLKGRIPIGPPPSISHEKQFITKIPPKNLNNQELLRLPLPPPPPRHRNYRYENLKPAPNPKVNPLPPPVQPPKLSQVTESIYDFASPSKTQTEKNQKIVTQFLSTPSTRELLGQKKIKKPDVGKLLEELKKAAEAGLSFTQPHHKAAVNSMKRLLANNESSKIIKNIEVTAQKKRNILEKQRTLKTTKNKNILQILKNETNIREVVKQLVPNFTKQQFINKIGTTKYNGLKERVLGLDSYLKRTSQPTSTSSNGKKKTSFENDTKEAIFEGQKALVERYIKIGNNNGIYKLFQQNPNNIDRLFQQKQDDIYKLFQQNPDLRSKLLKLENHKITKYIDNLELKKIGDNKAGTKKQNNFEKKLYELKQTLQGKKIGFPFGMPPEYKNYQKFVSNKVNSILQQNTITNQNKKLLKSLLDNVSTSSVIPQIKREEIVKKLYNGKTMKNISIRMNKEFSQRALDFTRATKRFKAADTKLKSIETNNNNFKGELELATKEYNEAKSLLDKEEQKYNQYKQKYKEYKKGGVIPINVFNIQK